MTIELARESEFQLEAVDADYLIRVSGEDRLWQKERLINVAIDALPPEVEYVAWVDCDVAFANGAWPEVAVSLLENGVSTVQLFQTAVHLPPALDGTASSMAALHHAKPLFTERSFAFCLSTGDYFLPQAQVTREQAELSGYASGYRSPVAHGMAWAAPRDLLRRSGLYDACVIGGGDSAVALAAAGVADRLVERRPMTDEHARHYLEWASAFQELTSAKVGYVPGRVFHFWHGRYQRRRYEERHELLKRLAFNPYEDIALTNNGTWRWRAHATELQQSIAEYFASRQEDDPF